MGRPSGSGMQKSCLRQAETRQSLHYSKMSEAARVAACDFLATTEARIFAAASWKPTMRGYRHPNAEKVGGRDVFYNIIVRWLLERVSHDCQCQICIADFSRGALRTSVAARKEGDETLLESYGGPPPFNAHGCNGFRRSYGRSRPDQRPPRWLCKTLERKLPFGFT
jgi:hypothetical protein